ncbi:MAG: hypothetical protein VXY05_00920 [Pseudomonadota bacterium]|nr:hypothetical protein [Pseudomonadota bacterium]
MKYYDRSVLLSLILFLISSGCVNTPPREIFPDLRYSHFKPISLAVNSVEIKVSYASPQQMPNVEHKFPVVPTKAASNWLKDRIRASGGTDSLLATVTKGSVVEVELPRTPGLKGAFFVDQSERYDGELEIVLEIIDPNGIRRAMVSSRAARSKTVAEDSTLSEREEIWFRITEAMMNDLNAALEKQISKHFLIWRR